MKSAELVRAAKQGNPPPIIVLYGSESYLLQRAFHQLRDAIVPVESRDFNYQQFYGRELEPAKVLEAVETLPVFAPRRLIVIRDAHEMASSKFDALFPLIEKATADSVLLILAEKIDSRRKFYQRIKKKGAVVEYKPLYENQIPRFVRDEARHIGLEFTEAGMRLFCCRVGTSLQEIVGQLHKIQNYMGQEGPVDEKEVALLVADSHQDSVFDLTNAIGQGDAQTALRLLRRLDEEGEPPLRVLAMVVRHYRQLWKVTEGLRLGLGKKELARHVTINPYFIDGLIAQAKRRSVDYPQVFERCLKTDLAMKSSGPDPAALLERLVLDLAFDR